MRKSISTTHAKQISLIDQVKIKAITKLSFTKME